MGIRAGKEGKGKLRIRVEQGGGNPIHGHAKSLTVGRAETETPPSDRLRIIPSLHPFLIFFGFVYFSIPLLSQQEKGSPHARQSVALCACEHVPLGLSPAHV